MDLLKRSCKTSMWPQKDGEGMTIPDSETPLVFFLHYANQDWDDELPPESLGRMKK